MNTQNGPKKEKRQHGHKKMNMKKFSQKNEDKTMVQTKKNATNKPQKFTQKKNTKKYNKRTKNKKRHYCTFCNTSKKFAQARSSSAQCSIY